MLCECSVCRAAAVERSGRDVVAAVLTHRGRLAVLRRSSLVSSDQGLWHCVTGYRPAAECPLAQAIKEISEEAGMDAGALTLRGRQELNESGADGRVWHIHAFHFETDTADVRLNWEHDAVKWTTMQGLARLPTVAWFGRILQVLQITAATAVMKCCKSAMET